MPGDEKEPDNAPVYDDTKDACNPENFSDETFEDEIVISAK